MALALFTFNETSPSSPGVVASVGPILGGAANAGAPGVALPLDDMQALIVEAILVGATGGTLDVYIQMSPDMGATWDDYAHFAQLANGAAQVRYVFSAATGAQNLALATIGANLSPLLAAATVVGGAWGDRVRLVMVAGAGTTVGATVKISVTGQRIDPRK